MTKTKTLPATTLKLTPKQEMFCREYVVDFNQTQAAIRSGYSKKTAFVIGNENINKPYIQKRIAELSKEILDKAEITQDMIAQELKTLGFSKITDYLKYDENGKIDFTASDKIDISKIGAIQSIKSTDTKEGKTFEFKLADKNKALDTLARLLKLYIDAPKDAGDTFNTVIINNYRGKNFKEKGEVDGKVIE